MSKATLLATLTVTEPSVIGVIKAAYDFAFVVMKFDAVAFVKVISLISKPVTSSEKFIVVVKADLVGRSEERRVGKEVMYRMLVEC